MTNRNGASSAADPRGKAMSGLLEKINKNVHHYGFAAQRAMRGLRWAIAPVPVREPVFVIGCSRGGTTVVYKTLSEAVELGSLQRETHDFWAELHPLAQRDWRSHALGAGDAAQRDRDIIARYF